MKLKINLAIKFRGFIVIRELSMILFYFKEFYKQHGIVHETTTPYSFEMNGKVERKNITFTE